MIPTSIDGTDITGATIDGTDVQEITVDGQTVFSAQTLPVGYSNLVAWYPFDSAEYGGSNADDVTAIIGGSGDDTAYNGTVIGGTYQSSGGVTDINAGANSGAFDFDGFSQGINLPNLGFSGSQDITVSLWFNSSTAISGDDVFFMFGNVAGNEAFLFGIVNGNPQIAFFGNDFTQSHSYSNNTWHNQTITFDSSTNQAILYADGQQIGVNTMNTPNWGDTDYGIGYDRPRDRRPVNGLMDDVRVYDTVLNGTEVNQVYQNTEP